MFSDCKSRDTDRSTTKIYLQVIMLSMFINKYIKTKLIKLNA